MTDCGVQLTEDEVVETIVLTKNSNHRVHGSSWHNSPHVLVLEIAQEVAVKTIIRETPGIKQTFVVGKTDDEDPTGSQPLIHSNRWLSILAPRGRTLISSTSTP